VTTLTTFLASFFPDENEAIYLRAFKAKGAPDSPDNRPLVEVVTRKRLATEADFQKGMAAANKTRGWYFVVNAGGNADADITHFNAFFVENDGLPIEEQHSRLDAAPLRPSIRLETRKSVHAYWLIKGECDVDAWRDIQERLIAHFDGDASIKNPSRVMRLPLFNHVHYDKENAALSYKRVTLVEYAQERRYSLEDMRAAFAPVCEQSPESSYKEAASDAGGFGTWDELHAEAARRIRLSPKSRTDRKGWTHAPGICHGSVEGKAQYVSPEGAYGCHNRCTGAQVRAAYGLPERPNTTEPDTAAQSNGGASKTAPRFVLTRLDDLLSEPEEQVAYVWDRTLPAGGTSICAAKPKVGKSTLARNLAVAITRGESFFGRETAKGKVIYLCLEEKRAEVAAHFRRMGAYGADIHIHTGRAPDDALAALQTAVDELEPLLVVVDPLSRFVRVRDFNDYAEVARGMEPMIDLARVTGCHILCVHHCGKGERDGGDALLGSTALFGAVDTLLLMKRKELARTLNTVQRYGEDMPETVAHLDGETGIVTAGGELATIQIAEREQAVLEAMGDESLTEPDIRERLGGNQTLTAKAIRALHEGGKLERTGAGRRGDPYRYRRAGVTSIESSILDSVDIGNRENRENRESGEADDELDWLADVSETDWMKDDPDAVRERAAIMEFDGLVPDEEAQRLAREEYVVAVC
jgi:hypothetical protein